MVWSDPAGFGPAMQSARVVRMLARLGHVGRGNAWRGDAI